MKRFIEPDELARDRRFKRAHSRNELFRSLPDDVPTIVRVLEEVAPKVRKRVEGTALESVFDELGPGFSFLTVARNSDERSERTPLQLRVQLHGIYVGELQALEAAGRTLWDFPESPWEFKMNMARQCWDEARHVQIYEKLIDHVGRRGRRGSPRAPSCSRPPAHDDPVLRVTGVNRCLEGLACDAFRSLMDYAEQQDDELMGQAVDFVLADELTHVRFGSDWVREFTRGDRERAAEARAFQRETDRRFAFGGGRFVAKEERREAGFSEEELEELDDILAEGPSRETLVRAAEILRDRHQARRRGETPPPI